MSSAYDAASRGDYKAALEIWTQLAHAGVPRAQSNIGACFSEGLGVERDTKLAERWLLLASEGGDPIGRRNLATLYFKGEGVEQDNARAAALYRAAAEQGDAQAQDMLSWMLLEGDGIAVDHAEIARRWAEAAAAQGVAASMTRLGMIFHNALGVERVRGSREVVGTRCCGRRCRCSGDAGRCLSPWHRCPAGSACGDDLACCGLAAEVARWRISFLA